MKCKKKIHGVYKEYSEAKKRGLNIRESIGKWQYIYSSDDGKIKISLVELKDYFMDGKDLWEIYCLGKQVFEDVERFNSKEEAEKRIKELVK